MPETRPLDLSDVDFGPSEPVKRTRVAKSKPITKAMLRTMFDTVNGGLAITGHAELALVDAELDALADTWFDVIKLYPSFGRYVSQGNTLTVWGHALFTTFIIVERRRDILTANTPGTAQSTPGNDGQRKDDVSASPSVVTPIRHSR